MKRTKFQKLEGKKKLKQSPSISDELPPTIDPMVAIIAFRRQRDHLMALVCHSLPSLSNSLFSQYIIPQNLCEKACNQTLGSTERSAGLLDCIEARINAVPADFIKVVDILKTDPFFMSQATDLIKSYYAISNEPTKNSSPAVTTSAIHSFSAYLKTVYNNSPISPDTKWPPTPSKEYIRLAVVEGDIVCRDEYIGHTLQGNIMDILKKRKVISIEQILEAEEGQKKLRLVLMEGAPGIGKTSLAWELCRKWEEFPCMARYRLVILLKLREEEVQKVASVCQLFCYYETEDQEALAKEVLKSHGKNILFILDGFDELPKPLQQKGFLLNLIKGSVLPKSTVLVTSRPSATGELLTSCRPQIQRHVEILGFTQESVEEYASSIFSSEPDRLERFKAYISASTNPAINSLMYVPLNAAIIVEIFRNCKSDHFLPHTLTEQYTQLCLTILNRYLKIHYCSVRADKFEDLPSNLYQEFTHLSKIAFTNFLENRVILQNVHPDMNHFGFLDAVPALYGGGGDSHNFLHLTLQEFFAAYYISQLGSSGVDIFQKHAKNERWNIVWRFVAGLTKFKPYMEHFDKSTFFQENDELRISLFFFQCLFEAKTLEYFSCTLELFSSTIARVEATTPTALDTYALGYCMANFPIGLSWDVKIDGSGHHSFSCGLNTSTSKCVIERLDIRHCRLDFHELKSNPLERVTKLRLVNCQLSNSDMIQLSELIPHLPHLKMLSIPSNRISDGQQDGLLRVLNQLCSSSVVELNLGNTGLGELLNSRHDYSSAMKHLIHPVSGRLQDLTVGCLGDFNDNIDDKLVDLLIAPSSLKLLWIFIDKLSPHALHLQNNTWLVKLGIACLDMSPEVPHLLAIVNNNKTLLDLKLFRFRIDWCGIDAIRPLVKAIRENTTLEYITLYVRGIGDSDEAVSDFMTTHHKELTLDSRIAWRYRL